MWGCDCLLKAFMWIKGFAHYLTYKPSSLRNWKIFSSGLTSYNEIHLPWVLYYFVCFQIQDYDFSVIVNPIQDEKNLKICAYSIAVIGYHNINRHYQYKPDILWCQVVGERKMFDTSVNSFNSEHSVSIFHHFSIIYKSQPCSTWGLVCTKADSRSCRRCCGLKSGSTQLAALICVSKALITWSPWPLPSLLPLFAVPTLLSA